MNHKCEYCDKEITACANPCSLRNDKNHVCCTCPSPDCELPLKVVCDGPICTMKLQIELYNSDLEALKSDVSEVKEEIDLQIVKYSKLKELNNHFRILGFSPSSLETLIKNFGLNMSGVFIAQNEKWSWDQLKPEDIATLGLNFMNAYEKAAKQWASFLNEKVTKITIQKSQLTATQENLKKASKIRSNGGHDTTKKNEPKARITLSPKEKLVLHNMKIMKLSQEDSIKLVESMGMKDGEVRDLKSLGVI